MGDLTAHFSRHEFRSKDGEEVGVPSCRLLGILEAIRAIAGRPLPIISGCRSQRLNESVGGARNSQHLKCEAADIPKGFVDEAGARRAGATGVGVSADGWAVHVDTGPARRWDYE